MQILLKVHCQELKFMTAKPTHVRCTELKISQVESGKDHANDLRVIDFEFLFSVSKELLS